MVSPSIAALLMALAGMVFLWQAWRGHRTGEVRGGSSGFKPYRPNRRDNPLAFRLFMAFHGCLGSLLLAWGLLALVGLVALPGQR